MSGRVIQTLRASLLATILSEAELRSLASCARIYEYAPGQVILETDECPGIAETETRAARKLR